MVMIITESTMVMAMHILISESIMMMMMMMITESMMMMMMTSRLDLSRTASLDPTDGQSFAALGCTGNYDK